MARRVVASNENGEVESNSRTETESVLSEQDFTEITKKVENTLSKKRQRDFRISEGDDEDFDGNERANCRHKRKGKCESSRTQE